MDDEYLQFAMRRAVDIGIFPRFSNDETYLKNWEMLEKLLEETGLPQQEDAADRCSVCGVNRGFPHSSICSAGNSIFNG